MQSNIQKLTLVTKICAVYAAAHVAARPIARHRPAIIVMAFLRCIATATLPLNSRAITSCGDKLALPRLANIMFDTYQILL